MKQNWKNRGNNIFSLLFLGKWYGLVCNEMNKKEQNLDYKIKTL